MILSCVPRIRRMIRNHGRHLAPEDRADLMSAAVLGLVEAATRFDENRHASFWLYARTRVQGAILDELRRKDPLTRTQRRQVRLVEKTFASLQESCGERPDSADLQKSTGFSPRQMTEIQNYRNAARSLKQQGQTSCKEDGYTDPGELPDTRSPLPEEVCLQSDQLRQLSAWVLELGHRDRQVIDGIYFRQLTLRELGRELSLTEGRISQIHHKALEQLRCIALASDSAA